MFLDGEKKIISSRLGQIHFRKQNSSLPAFFRCGQLSETRPITAPHPQADEKMRCGRHWFPSLPFQQFQVLFNSLFKVLCIFPSRYLFAIGFPPIFSFRWNLPPTLSCNPKQLDSENKAYSVRFTGVSPSLPPYSKGLDPTDCAKFDRPQFDAERRLTSWAFPTSVALTEGILVSFFSSAY